MKCSLNSIILLVALGIALLGVAIGLAYAWPTAYPLFGAAAAVASVSFIIIPMLKSALADYATCRGPSQKCSMSIGINNLGQAAAILSVISFTVAAVLQIAALAFLLSWFLSWIGVAMEPAVYYLVHAGIVSCIITIGILAGVLTDAYAYKNCMDKQDSSTGGITSVGGTIQ